MTARFDDITISHETEIQNYKITTFHNYKNPSTNILYESSDPISTSTAKLLLQITSRLNYCNYTLTSSRPSHISDIVHFYLTSSTTTKPNWNPQEILETWLICNSHLLNPYIDISAELTSLYKLCKCKLCRIHCKYHK